LFVFRPAAFVYQEVQPPVVHTVSRERSSISSRQRDEAIVPEATLAIVPSG